MASIYEDEDDIPRGIDAIPRMGFQSGPYEELYIGLVPPDADVGVLVRWIRGRSANKVRMVFNGTPHWDPDDLSFVLKSVSEVSSASPNPILEVVEISPGSENFRQEVLKLEMPMVRLSWVSAEDAVAEFINRRLEADYYCTVDWPHESVGRNTLKDFWYQKMDWSRRQFGDIESMGAAGPLKHMLKELTELEFAPHDLMEYADMTMLVFDAAWRSLLNWEEIQEAGFQEFAFIAPSGNPIPAMRRVVAMVLTQERPRIALEGVIEMLASIFGLASQMGFSGKQLLGKCFEKLEINKNRKWLVNTKDGAVEHVRT